MCKELTSRQEELREEIENWLLANDDTELIDIVRELNGYNGSFEDLQYYNNNEEFFNIYFEGKPMEVARAICYGEYNYCDDYVKFNAYGNLESANEYDIVNEIKDSLEEVIDELIENFMHIYIHSDLEELLEAYVDAEYDEEDEE